MEKYRYVFPSKVSLVAYEIKSAPSRPITLHVLNGSFLCETVILVPFQRKQSLGRELDSSTLMPRENPRVIRQGEGSHQVRVFLPLKFALDVCPRGENR